MKGVAALAIAAVFLYIVFNEQKFDAMGPNARQMKNIILGGLVVAFLALGAI